MNLDQAHFLICRTDNIGDVVLTLPLAGYLRQRFPNAKIGFLCRSYAAPMVRLCRSLDYVVESDKLDDMTGWLRQSGVDTILFGKPQRKLAQAAWRAGVKNRVGTSHRWFHWIFCNRLAHFSRVKSELHEAQLNFELLKPLGIDNIPSLEELASLYDLDAPDYTSDPPLARNGFNLVIHPKSNGNGREWPLAHYVELARMLKANPDVRLWVTGSAKEGEAIAQQAPELFGMSNVINVCGLFGLDELASLIRSANGLVASGTGPLHLSAALGQATLGLFPPIRPIHPGRWGAIGKRAEVLVEPSCAGCPGPQDCACMRNITPQQVAAVVLRWREQAR